MRFAAGDHLRAFGDGIGNVFFNFGHGFLVDQRAGGDAVLQAVANAQFFHRLLQLLGETVIHPVLDVQAVGADAGLPGVAELRRQRPLDGFIEVGIVKDDKRRVAAQLQGDFFDVFRALLHQLAANLGRAGKGELAHQRVAGQFAADRPGGTGDHVEHPGGDPGAIGQFGQRQRGKRRLAGRFQDHGAAGGQRRARFAGDHRRREVPRGDGGGNADGLLNHQQALVGLVARNGVAVDALTFFGEPLNKGGGVADFAFGFRQRFSLLEGHQASEIVLILHHKIEPAAQNVRPLFGGQGAPGG